MPPTIATLLGSTDWEATPLGPQARWPLEMRSTVQTMMAADAAVCMLWGRDNIQIYNDAAIRFYGDRHPAAFGAPLRQTWPDLWARIGEIAGQLRNGPQGVTLRQSLPLRRDGAQGSILADLSCSAITSLKGDPLGVMILAREVAGPAAPATGAPPDDPARRARHDLNNLLTVILGTLDTLHENPADERSRTLVDNAIGAAEEACALVRALPRAAPALVPTVSHPAGLPGAERRALEQVASGGTAGSILADLCRALADAFDGAQCALALADSASPGAFALHAPPALAAFLHTAMAEPDGEGLNPWAAAVQGDAPVIQPDIAASPEPAPWRAAAARHGIAALWGAPVHDLRGTPAGCLIWCFPAPLAPDAAQATRMRELAALVSRVCAQLATRDRLQDTARHYRLLFDHLPIAVWEADVSGTMAMLSEMAQSGLSDPGAWMDANPDFVSRAVAAIRVINANRAACAMHGVSEGDHDALSMSLVQLTRHPEFGAAVKKVFIAALSGVTQTTVSMSIPQSGKTAIEVMAELRLIHARSGRLLVIQRDVTDLHRAEERFRHVAQAASDYIFDRDFATETTWVNDGASWHPDLPEGPCVVPRGAWVESIHPDDSERIVKGIEAALQDGAAYWEGEYRLRRRDGGYIPVRERAGILRDADGKPVRMIGNIVDLTEQRALEAQLRQAQRLDAIGQLTGGITHDFNNLLTVILGNAEMLAEALPPGDAPESDSAGPAPSEMARQIVSAAERAAELTRRLLAFARQQTLAPGIHEAETLINGMRSLIQHSLTPSITLELALGDDLGTMHVDAAMFESALLNLCLNARDAMPEGGTLRIEAGLIAPAPGSDQGRIRIAVSDTGTGMDAETRARAFEPFFTTKPVGEGSGLGLSMVYGFAQQSGGEVEIVSQPGKGTTVSLLLPAHGARTGEEGAPPPAPPASQTRFRGRVLIVDDNAPVRRYTCMLARALGFDVVDEPQADRALERLRAGEPFDLLVSDVVMPGAMSGLELARAVRKEWPALPVLLVSGHSEDIAALRANGAAPTAFLSKPFRKQDLSEAIAQLLTKRG